MHHRASILNRTSRGGGDEDDAHPYQEGEDINRKAVPKVSFLHIPLYPLPNLRNSLLQYPYSQAAMSSVSLLAPGKPIRRFPDPRKAGAAGVVAFGGNLHPDTLRTAYRQGIFPWPHEGVPLPWFCPPMRAILEFDSLHIPESLEKARRKSRLTFSIDRAFPSVIEACSASPRPGQEGTWITNAMRRAYCRMHELGDAHSVEVWDEEGNLVGGLYGMDAGGLFAGESMFYRVSNASKFALLFLIDHLASRGADWLDIQQLTPHMAMLGAREIRREEFLERLALEQAIGRSLFDRV